MEDENKIECAFVECGHMLACRSCASKLKSCPVCRSEIQQVLKLYKATSHEILRVHAQYKDMLTGVTFNMCKCTIV